MRENKSHGQRKRAAEEMNKNPERVLTEVTHIIRRTGNTSGSVVYYFDIFSMYPYDFNLFGYFIFERSESYYLLP